MTRSLQIVAPPDRKPHITFLAWFNPWSPHVWVCRGGHPYTVACGWSPVDAYDRWRERRESDRRFHLLYKGLNPGLPADWYNWQQ